MAGCGVTILLAEHLSSEDLAAVVWLVAGASLLGCAVALIAGYVFYRRGLPAPSLREAEELYRWPGRRPKGKKLPWCYLFTPGAGREFRSCRAWVSEWGLHVRECGVFGIAKLAFPWSVLRHGGHRTMPQALGGRFWDERSRTAVVLDIECADVHLLLHPAVFRRRVDPQLPEPPERASAPLSDVPPLAYGDVPAASRLERVCRWIPILGWAVGYELANARVGPDERRLAEQLASRPPVPMAAWGGEERARVARRIGRICWELCWLLVEPAPDRFLPADPMEVVLLWRYGDFCEVEALTDIEEAFGLRIDDEELEGTVLDMTLGEFVDYVLERRGSRARGHG